MKETLATIKMVCSRDESGQVAMTAFARDDNNMVIGIVAQGTSVFGEAPENKETRHFLADDFAIQYMKGKCREYLGREDVTFLVSEGAPIIQPAQSMPKRRM